MLACCGLDFKIISNVPFHETLLFFLGRMNQIQIQMSEGSYVAMPVDCLNDPSLFDNGLIFADSLR